MNSPNHNLLRFKKCPLWYRLDGIHGEATLYKYSPKYAHSLIIDGPSENTHKWVSKVKSLKVLKVFSAYPLQNLKKNKKSINPFLLNLLQHQRQNLRNLRGVNSSMLKYFPKKVHYSLNYNSLESMKSFFWLCQLQSLKIVYETSQQPLTKAMKNKIINRMPRFSPHLKKLSKLKHVGLFIEEEINKDVSLILSKLNDSEDTLKHLKTLKIRMKITKVVILKSTESLFRNISHYATDLELQDTHSFSLDYIRGYFQNFTNLNVLKLSLPLEPYAYETGYHSQSLDYLTHIGKLPSLVEFRISLVWFNKNFSRDFFKVLEIPPMVEKFGLTLINPKWEEVIKVKDNRDWEYENPFDKKEVFLSFYDKWKDLKSLQSLSIRLENSHLFSIPSISFIIPILSRLTTLNELIFETLPAVSPGIKKQCLDWNYFWGKIAHLRQNIRTLVVKEAAISLQDFKVDPSEKLDFRILELGKYIIGADKISGLTGLFMRNREHERAKLHTLKLDHFVVENAASLSKFLEGFIGFPKNIELTMHADLRHVSKEELMQRLCEFIPKLSTKRSLDINFTNVSWSFPREDRKTLRAKLIKNPVFCYLEILRKGGQTLYLFDKEYYMQQENDSDHMINGENTQEFNTWIAENAASEISYDEMEDEEEEDDEMENDHNIDDGDDNIELGDSDSDDLSDSNESKGLEDEEDASYEELNDIISIKSQERF